MPLTSGTRLHAYEIVGPIGAGGMGEVYKAHDARLGRDVAIKVLPASLAADPASLARFEREARAIGALNHPNIVNVFDTGAEGGVAYVVMELLEGETLRARLQGTAVTTPAATNKTPKPGSGGATPHGLPKKKALEIAQQIAHGLAAAHARGIVHRDLKPENILLTNDGRVKILDFGLARAVPGAGQPGAEGETRLSPAASDSVPGMVFGTIGYMAPEQVRGQHVDHRADIFAFGVVLYEMLTGARAFEADSPIETMTAILKSDPLEQPIATVAVTGPIEPLLRHCLEKLPDERFQSARDLAFQLQAIASGSLTTSSAERTLAARPARRILVPLVIALVAFALGLAAERYLFTAASRDTTISLAAPMPPGIRMAAGVSPARSGGLAVSRDGRQIAFVGVGAEGAPQIFVRALDAAVARAVPGTEGGVLPAFSPDGRHLAFWQAANLKRIPVEGGAPQVITQMVNPRAAPAWGDNDMVLFHSDYRVSLQRVSATGGQPTEALPAQDRDRSWFSPVWLPGTERFLVVLFAYRDEAADGAGIYAGTSGSKDLTLLVPGRVAEVAVGDRELFYRRGSELVVQPFDSATLKLSGQPSVLTDRASMIAAGGPTLSYYDPPGGLSHGHRITWFSRDGTVVAKAGAAGTLRDPRLSPDGRFVAVARANENGLFSLWSHDVARSIDTRVSTATYVAPVWTPDGRSIIAGSQGRVMRFEPGGSPEGSLVRPITGYGSLYDVTPDGRRVVGFSLGAQGATLIALDLDGRSDAQPIASVTGALAVANSAALSPDGKWIAVRASEGTARITGRLYAMPADGRGRQIVVTGDEAAQYPRWRRDALELYYLTINTRMNPGTATIMAVPVTWADGTPDFGAPQPLFTVKNITVSNLGFDATADGQKFVAIVSDEPDRLPLTVRLRARQ